MTELTFVADRKSATHSSKPNDSTNKNSEPETGSFRKIQINLRREFS
jgi:hypothetical protein